MVAMRAADEVLREVVARAERLTVRQVGPEESSVHVAVGSAGFEAPAFIFECLMPPKAMAAPQVSCFVGYVAEQPVTTAVAVTHGDHVGIYSVATSPEHRGRGYGAAVTARACLAGFAAGAEFAYLQSSPIGYGVYRSLGFQTVESWELWVGEPAGAGSARG
jgi:ribosomal protein S18 acetylase RimI-like enzyme